MTSATGWPFPGWLFPGRLTGHIPFWERYSITGSCQAYCHLRQRPPGRRRITGDANGDDNASNDRLPGVRRNSFLGPDYATTDMRVTRRLLARDRLKLDLIVESFNLLNRDNQRVQITDNGFQNSAGNFVQSDNSIGIRTFPRGIPHHYELPACHRRLCARDRWRLRSSCIF